MSKRPGSTLRTSRFSRLLTGIVALSWLVLIGFLVKDRWVPASSIPTKHINISAVESDDWFVIRIRGAYAGFGRSRQIRRKDHWTLRDELNISLNLQGRLKPVSILNESQVDDEFKLQSFDLKVSSGIISFDMKGDMQGRDLVLEMPKIRGGGTQRLRLHERPRITRSLGLPLPLTGLKVGDTIRVPIFDPLEGGKSDAIIRVLEQAKLHINGRAVEAWRVRAEFRAAEIVMWIDKDGKLLKGIMPLGITVVRSNPNEIASQMRGTRKLPDMLSISSVPLEGNLPDPSSLKELRLRLKGIRDTSIPSTEPRQSVSGDVVKISREEIPKATYSLPSTDREMEPFLRPSRFIRSDNPEIIKKAKEIVGNVRDPVQAAQRINTWVYGYLKKVPTPAVPDAYTVLQTRQGDCNEHAILAVSLARAVGLPARIAIGLVYANGGFFYHAWVIYWTGTMWLTGDPLMDQMPADPSHVALFFGDVDKHMNVISFIGRLKMKVVKAVPVE